MGKSTLEKNMEFTVDATRYPNIEETISDLHNKEKVLLVDTRPAILVRYSLEILLN